MNHKKIINITTFITTLILLSSISVSAYAISHDSSNDILKKIEIHSINSKAAKLSKISIFKRKTSYKVSGNVHIKTMQRRVLALPGYVSVELKNANGEILETAKARLHHKYGKSKVAHFDAVLKMTPPIGSSVVVTHHG